jgi:c-di-GMP-binding flagellar brake protein YcgR
MDHTITPEKPVATTRVFSFADMGLHVGLSLYMRPRDPTLPQVRHQVEYIGALRGKSFMTTLPLLHDKGLWMQNGQEFVFHVMEGMHVYAFTSRVLRARNSPFPYVHFAYPDKIEARQVRKSYRVRMHLPVSVAVGEAPRQDALLLNLSMTGALVEAPTQAWKQNETLSFVLPITMDEVSCELVFHATVRSWEEKGATAHYGLEFASLAQQDALFLHYFIDHTIAVAARG